MTEREENSRILAEWVEPKPSAPDVVLTCRSLRDDVRSPMGAWRCELTGEPFGAEWIPADFYTDETANGLLRDKLPYDTKIERHPEGWSVFVPHLNVMGQFDYMPQEWKAAICAAALLITRPQS